LSDSYKRQCLSDSHRQSQGQDLALKGYERAAPAGHESQLAYGSPVFAVGGIPISHRCRSLPDNPYATGDPEASDVP
jgi:hypothetical protein